MPTCRGLGEKKNSVSGPGSTFTMISENYMMGRRTGTIPASRYISLCFTMAPKNYGCWLGTDPGVWVPSSLLRLNLFVPLMVRLIVLSPLIDCRDVLGLEGRALVLDPVPCVPVSYVLTRSVITMKSITA